MIGHRLMGTSLLHTGEIAQGRVHYDQALALYDPAAHRPLATRFGQDIGVMILCFRSMGLMALGYPEAALADTDTRAQRRARYRPRRHFDVCAAQRIVYPYLAAEIMRQQTRNADELAALAEEKGALLWKAFGMSTQGCLLP